MKRLAKAPLCLLLALCLLLGACAAQGGRSVPKELEERGELTIAVASDLHYLSQRLTDNGLLFVKRFPDIAPTQPAPKEAEIQVYVNAGKTFIELEAQGPYTSLKPGEALSWTVCWYLLPQECGETPSQGLMDLVKSVVK